MSRWTLRLARDDAAVLAALRLTPGLEIAEHGAEIWLRGDATDEKLLRALKAVPALERFEWTSDNQLRPLQSRLPTVTFPKLDWHPIARWSRVELPLAALPSEAPPRTGLRLVRSGQERRPNVLLLDFGVWKTFALQAPELRLRPLKFAVSSRSEAVIWGLPLPALPGRLFVEESGVAVPAGFTWWPQVSSGVLRQMFQAADEALVLWDEKGVRRLHAEQLIAVSRGAVRATAAAVEAAR